ncbi:MAG: D-aminoacylase [Chloroflexota bacterium]|nr:D-aminoacylase [Chloroflexota bacterium]
MLDTIIKNGTIVDGTGQLRYKADIGIQAGHIQTIGKLQDVSAKQLIDASTLIVAPGFIDMHSHSDMSLFDDPGGESKAFQGVTTEVTGNCSYSAFPIAKDRKGDLGMGSMDWPVEWEWNDLDGWAKALESKGISINIAPQLGQAALQVAVGAVEERPVTRDEMREMQRLAEESIEQGAFALSTGLSLSPSGYMQTEEVSELMKVLSRYEGVFYVTHSRFGAGKHVTAIEEAVEIGRTASVPVHYSHLAIIARPDLGGWKQPEGLRGHGPEMLDVFENARNHGIDITYDTYPFTAAGAGVDQLVPIWAQAGGTETYMQRLKNQSTRDSIRKEVAAGTGGVPPRFDTWIISDVESDTNQNLVGRSIAEVAEQRNVDPAEATLQLEEEERGAVSAVVHGRAERDVEYFLSHPIGMIGSDGNAVSPTGSQSQKQIHPRFYGTYPRILGRYVREQSLISLETAIEKMTGMPAARLGITDRGQVLEGLVADLVIFDQKKIIDHSTFEKPHQLSEGIQYLLVNGEPVISNGIHTQSRAGRVLRRRK